MQLDVPQPEHSHPTDRNTRNLEGSEERHPTLVKLATMAQLLTFIWAHSSLYGDLK